MYRKQGSGEDPSRQGHDARVLGEAGIWYFPLCCGQSDVA